MFEQEDTQTLTKLGLTSSQAKVYLALIKLGNANARTLWKAAKVSRQDVYRLLTELREIGLIEKILKIPTEFRAVPIEDGIFVLIGHKTKKLLRLEKEANRLIEKFKKSNLDILPKPQDNQYVILPKGEFIVRKINNAIENTQKRIDFISSQDVLVKGMYFIDEEIEKASKRGVKIRWIIDKPENPKEWLKIVQTLIEAFHFELRTIAHFPYVRFGIYDMKEVLMTCFPKSHVLESQTLWSSNISFVRMAISFFDTLWSTALKIN